MKCLVVTEGGAGPILPLVPLVQALRSAGHEVIATAHAGATPLFLEAGIPAVAAPQKEPRDYRETRDGQLLPLPEDLAERTAIICGIAARIAADSYADLRELVGTWRPDLVIGGPLAIGAALIAGKLDVPLVTVEFGMAEPLDRHLATLDALRTLGFDDLPEPALTLLLCPRSIRPADAASGEPVRFIPYTPARLIEPWMVARADRPRVWVSAGSRVSADNALDDLTGMIEAVAELDVELLIAAPDDVTAELGPLPANARAGWLPFDVLAPTCDLTVHHGGGATMLGCVAGGSPQVVIPFMPELVPSYEPLARSGAATLITGEHDMTARVYEACRTMLREPSYREAAARLREELAAMPTPAALVSRLEAMTRVAVGS